MGRVKQAILEVDDFVHGCLKEGNFKSNSKRC